MKKFIMTLSTVIIFCLLIIWCTNISKQSDTLTVYSFSGENEQLSVSNGVIILSDTEEICYGGTLTTKEGNFSNLTEFTHTIYAVGSDTRNPILSMNSVDMTGAGLNLSSDDIGKISKTVSTNKNQNEWENNLYYELKTTDSNNEEDIYQLKLTLIEVTDNNTK